MILESFRRAALAIFTLVMLAVPVAAESRRVLARPANPEPTPVDVRTLPRIPSLSHDPRVIPLVSGFTLSDSFLVQSWGFDDHTGACSMRAWQGLDLTPKTYTTFSDRYLFNQLFYADVSGLGYQPPFVSVGASPVPAVGTFIGRVKALARDGAGHAVALADTTNPSVFGNARLVALRLMPAGWVAFGTSLPLNFAPSAMAYDPAHARILVFDATSGTLLALPENGGALQYVAGDPSGSTADTTGVRHAFGEVRELACDAAGNAYYATTGRIRELRTDGRIVTLAGNGTDAVGPDGSATGTQVAPRSVAASPAGDELLIAETGSLRIRRIAGGVIASRFDVSADPRIRELIGVTRSGSGYLVRALAPVVPVQMYPGSIDFSPGLVLVAEGDSLRRVAGDGNHAPPFDVGPGAPQPLRRGIESFGLFTDDGAGGAIFNYVIDEMVNGTVASGSVTSPILHLVPGVALTQVAGIGLTVNMQTRGFAFGARGLPVDDVPPDALNQFLVSPPVPTNGPNGVQVRMDCLWMSESLDAGDYLTVEAQRADGSWTPFTLTAYSHHNWIELVLFPNATKLEAGQDWTKLVARPIPGTVLPTTTRIRVRVKNVSIATAEPGTGVVDNLVVEDTTGVALLPMVDFENETTGSWALGALNGAFNSDGSHSGPAYAPPENVVAPVDHYDFSNASCVWSFFAGRDSMPYGTDAALVSPWVAVARPDSAVYTVFSGKVSDVSLYLVFQVEMQTKSRAGAITGAQQFGPFFNSGSDIEQPYFDGLAIRYVPPDTAGVDSVRAIFRLADRVEQFTPNPPPSGVPHPTRFPYVDDVRIVQFSSDHDFDGVADLRDGCADVSAIGQDADGDGCVDPTATLRHVETWPLSKLPIVYHFSTRGDPRITDGSTFDAIRRAFQHWTAVTSANAPVVEGAPVAVENASTTDGVNLITFTDPDFSFPDNVVAVTPTLSFSRRGAFDDTMYLPGQVLDADILFNPAFHFSTPTFAAGDGSFDLESVATHEIGHLLGLSHSGVLDAVMFYVLQQGTLGRALTPDDSSAVGAAYPNAAFATLATVKGTVRRGPTLEPIRGGLVTAVQLNAAGSPQDTVASDYTDESGRYALRGLAPGNYGVRLTPLDGEVGGVPLVPDDISLRVANIADTDFDGEWWSAGDSDRDDPNVIGMITLHPAEALDSINVVTNIDTIPPAVVSVSPPDSAHDVRIDTQVLVRFNERLDRSTFSGSTFVLKRVDTGVQSGGTALSLDNDRAFAFTADPPLAFDTDYRLTLTTGLTDRQGVHLAGDHVTTFRTMVKPPVSISDVRPRQAPVGAFVTINGDGFDPTNAAANPVTFACTSCTPVTVTPASVTLSAIVVQVPSVSGATATITATVTVAGVPSNAFDLTILPDGTQPAPSPLGDPIAIGLEPSDVTVSADGLLVYAVGPSGLAVIDRSGVSPVVHNFSIGPARSTVVAPARDLLYITRPDSADVVVVGADPAAVLTFGHIVQRIPVGEGGRPDAVAMTTAGTRLFVGDERLPVHYLIDTDSRSFTRFNVLREMNDSAAVLNGGLAISPGSDRIYYTTANEGVRQFRLADSQAGALATTTAERGASVSISGIEAVFAGGVAASGKVQFVDLLSATHPTTSVELGGSIRDVATMPQGTSALAVNNTFNRLHVVSLDFALSTYHQPVAEVATGAGPVAVATNQDGSLVAVANAIGKSVSLYGTGSTASLLRVVPPVAVAGAHVALQGSAGLFAPGSFADFGGTSAGTVTIATGGSAAGVVVPGGAQDATSVAVVGTDGRRTTNLAFTRLDPVTRFAPAATGYGVPLGVGGCGAPSGALAAESPSGDRLAVARTVGGCNARLTIVGAASGASFLTPQVSAVDLGAAAAPSGVAFRSDGAELWVVQSGRPALLVVSLTSGPGFGSLVTSALTGANPAGLAMDPLGRWMCVSDRATNAALLVDPGTHAVAASVPLGGAAGAVAATPEGRWLVCGRGNGAAIVDGATHAISALTPVHASAPAAIAVTADGRRAVATFPVEHAVAVWNLDPASGPVGQEIFFGAAASGVTGSWGPIVAAPNAGGVVVGAPDVSELVRLDVGGASPVATRASISGGTSTLARSSDGRRLWRAAISGTSLAMLAVDEATQLTVLSGQNQSGPPGSTLPLPVVVRVSDTNGAGEAGVTVRFAVTGATPGTLDGGAATIDARTDVTGAASVAWTLPAIPGTTQLSVSVAGFAAGPTLLTATATANDADIVPVVTELGPSNGASGILADSPLFARFNQSMDPASLTNAVHLKSGSLVLPGTLEHQESGHVVIFHPQSPMTYGATLVWEVTTSAHDMDGQALAALAQASFTVQAAPQLTLGSVYPPAGPVGTAIALTGTGFSSTPGLNTVRIGGVVAPVSTASATELDVRVPEGVPTGHVGVFVQVGTALSDTVEFVVHITDPTPSDILAQLLTGEGVSAALVAPDAPFFYFANFIQGTVTVAHLTSTVLTLDTVLTVGYQPIALAITPDGRRLYVANAGGHDVAVVENDPGHVNHRITERIPLSAAPLAIAYSASREELYIVVGTLLNVVDARPGDATYHQVTATLNTGSSGHTIVVNPDGGECYFLTDDGHLLVIDLTSQAVTATLNTGSSGHTVVITPDGGLLIALLADGRLIVIDNNPSSSKFHQVTATINTGTSGHTIVLTPDGGSVLELTDDGTVYKFAIQGSTTNGSRAVPGSPVSLVLVSTLKVGQGPGALLVDPLAGRYYIATSPGTGQAVLVGVPDLFISVTGTLSINPNVINLKSNGQWITATIGLPAPYSVSDIVLTSLRLNGVVPYDANAPVNISAGTLQVRFDRSAVQLVLPPGDSVPVTVTGIVDGVGFKAVDHVRVRAGTVTSPHAGEIVAPGTTYSVRWNTPPDVHANKVAVLQSLDAGRSWKLVVEQTPNTGLYAWLTPSVVADSVRVAVALIESMIDPDSLVVSGVLATSDVFHLYGLTDVTPAPSVLTFSPVRPNPASGRATFRFGLPSRAQVTLELFDVGGRRVRTLVDAVKPAGWHELTWSGGGDRGGTVGAGIYFARLRVLGVEKRQRVVWLK